MLDRLRNTVKSRLHRWPRLFVLAKRAYGYSAYRLGIAHDPDFAFFRNLQGVTGLFVDIGANSGQSARSLRVYNRSLNILSFEPNRLLEPELRFTRRLLGDSFQYHMLGLGSHDQSATLYVPLAGGTPQTPWATTDRAVLEGNRAEIERELRTAISIATVPIDVRVFDELELCPLAVKIDVEGFELDVLRGMRETLARDEPILMIESNASAAAVGEFLAAHGYALYAYDLRHNTLRPVSDVGEVNNYFACTPGAIERLSQSDNLRILTGMLEEAEAVGA